ncbi:FKBP-type peptidyl-prolyl cis-trans isomerase [Burkholderia ubonensis]|uniref:FKBP-type peptidyl-prolyl cis-trans isomerase n=1 Tax=Burkholderia ubonensis TaxID=101571 RepID=UPI000B3223C9|nr:FKBP-type peptidyl-prolyl cis-trans isomerase [Burkholderia ubonensis]
MLKKAALILAATMGVSALAHAQANVETLPSGVRVEHIVKGTGEKPTANNLVTVHYRGTLVANGAEFDSSYKRGQPASFGLRQVIPCWTDGMQHIAVGGKAVLVCPANTAYGSRGAGGAVPPNADLRFEVELLGVR